MRLGPEVGTSGPFDMQHPVTRNPVIREIEIVLFRTTDEGHPEGPQSVKFGITIDDQWGHPMNSLHGNLLPHLTSAQIQSIISFMDAMWTKAQSEVIPN